ncbi:DUF222 domain-containing protein [Agromyces archimandritae]|uniref:DUF222 domain-containing protein n=1 Tax=Agromyces archimandritae TaxID=2781962 RepID=A0A975FMU9_9MICO|nr:DUF222 domain-containing protein [Agromyces archimandritae]QTX04782.1 DUF222 domain-containing protein [Agromyces archimandritae]
MSPTDAELAVAEMPSPYAMAHDDLGVLVDAVARSRRMKAMQYSIEVLMVHTAVAFTVQNADAFTSPTLSPERRHEMARRTVTAELGTTLRIAEQTMSRLIDEAEMLCTVLPATLAALRDGEIDEAHVRVIVSATVDLGDEPETLASLDEKLAERARELSPARLRRVAHRLREETRAETLAERHARALAERRVELEPAEDGMAWLHLYLEASDALLIHDRLSGIARADAQGACAARTDLERTDLERTDLERTDLERTDLERTDLERTELEHTGRAESDGTDSGTGTDIGIRTPAQRRADAARDLLLEGTTTDGAAASIRPTVHVTVPVLTLLGHDEGSREEPGELDGYGPIPAATARRLAAHAPSFTRLLTHPVSGTVLDVDRTVYRPPADLTAWLRVRDETCRFPGCNRRASGCDLDHTRAFADGGTTSFDNLAHLCRKHHTLKHESTWRVRAHRDGELSWTSPTGRIHRTTPARAMQHPEASARAAVSPGHLHDDDPPPW